MFSKATLSHCYDVEDEEAGVKLGIQSLLSQCDVHNIGESNHVYLSRIPRDQCAQS